MKKELLGTSAITLATAIAIQAHTAEFDLNVGGYFESRVAYSSSDVDINSNVDADAEFGGVDVKRDNEINFKPAVTLDNGIKIGATVELEGATSGDQIDEAYLSVNGNFGRVLLGSENSARYLMQYGAPDVTFVGVNSGDATSFFPISGGDRGADIFRGTLGSSYIENERNNDAERITYFSPRSYGVQFGVSYARDSEQDSNGQVDISAGNDNPLSNIIDLGLNYVGNTAGVDLAASAGYGIALVDRNNDPNTRSNDESNNPQVWNAGLNVGWRNWTVGGSFAEQNNGNLTDGSFYDAGISYESGLWGFSFTYAHGENVDNDRTGGSADTAGVTPRNNFDDGRGESLDQYLIGVSYDLAKGIELNGYGMYVAFEEDAGNNEITAGENIDGFAFGSGIRINF